MDRPVTQISDYLNSTLGVRSTYTEWHTLPYGCVTHMFEPSVRQGLKFDMNSLVPLNSMRQILLPFVVVTVV